MQVKGLDFDGWTLAEVRAMVRGKSEGGGVLTPPPVRPVEHVGQILKRMQSTGELPRAKE